MRNFRNSSDTLFAAAAVIEAVRYKISMHRCIGEKGYQNIHAMAAFEGMPAGTWRQNNVM